MNKEYGEWRLIKFANGWMLTPRYPDIGLAANNAETYVFQTIGHAKSEMVDNFMIPSLLEHIEKVLRANDNS